MARACSVCIHPKVNEVNALLISNAVCREIAAKYALSQDAVERHKVNHLPKALTLGKAIAEEVASESLYEQLRSLSKRAREAIDQAAAAEETGTVPQNINAYRATLELLAKMMGELPPDVQVALGIKLAGGAAETDRYDWSKLEFHEREQLLWLMKKARLS